MNTNTNISIFQTQKLWQDSKQLVLEINKVSKIFSDDVSKEYGRIIRNKSLKILSNIASFYSFDNQSKTEYLVKAKENVIVIQNTLILCFDSKYLSPTLYNHLMLLLSNCFANLEQNLRNINS